MSSNVEQRVFDHLQANAGVEACEVCGNDRDYCRSIRQALYRLRTRGKVDAVVSYGARLWFVLRDASRPTDDRGQWRKS